jgi:2-furoyl-CoA dehydrogenase large subunit
VIEKVLARANYGTLLLAERDHLRGQGFLAGIGMAACLEPSGQILLSSCCSIPRTRRPPMSIPAASMSMSAAPSPRPSISSRPEGHETLVGTVIGELFEIEPYRIRVVRPTHCRHC